MEREIEFKGRTKYGKWRSGSLVRDYRLVGTPSESIIRNGNSSFEVESETVCQYTGMKDNRQFKIFEFDYYRQEDDDNNTYVIICVFIKEIASFCWLRDCEYINYIDNGYGALYDNGVPFNMDELDLRLISIVGNIIDNPIDSLIKRVG